MLINNPHNLVEGLYFNMSDDEYHALPCLSASGLKTLETDPSKFWFDSWMNPDKKSNDTEAKIIGRAFHKRILEGKEKFYQSYAREFSTDIPDIIKTSEDVKQALQNEGLATSFKSKKEGIDRLIQHNHFYQDKYYDLIKADYELLHEGKIFLSDWLVDRIEICGKVIENHPYLKASFVGGYPEVTCIWYDTEYKEWFKCRYDYLKISAINDLKTFSRLKSTDIEKYLPEIISTYRYYIPASLYIYSTAYAKRFAKEGKVFGEVDSEWLKAFSERTCEQFHFVFQQKEGVPNAFGAIYTIQDIMHETAMSRIRIAVDNYKKYSAEFGVDMWHEIRKPLVLTGDDYPIWAYN